MALPTVRYHEAAAGTDAMLISVFMPKLQELLFDAGWTLEFADADAIGGGSAEEPAWDKTPAINQNAGIAVYQMPANDHDTEWYVRLRLGWGASQTTRVAFLGLQIGVSHDGDGNVSGGGSETSGAHTQNGMANQGWVTAVSEDGMVFLVEATGQAMNLILERARLLDGTVTDGLIVHHQRGSTLESRYITAALGASVAAPPVSLMGHTPSGTVATPSLESNDATQVVVTGPYQPGGNPFFAPFRLAVTASPADVDAASDRDIDVDGGIKTYRSMNTAMSASAFRWLVATE